MRWNDLTRGERRRSDSIGLIFYYLSADHQIWFFTLHDKDQAADLTTKEKKVLKKAIQAELEARRRKS